MSLSDLKIGKPALRVFLLIGIDTVEACANYTKKELLNLHGVGPKAIRLIEDELSIQNLMYKN